MIPIRRIFSLVSSKAFMALTFFGNAFLLVAVIAVYFLERHQNPAMDSFLDALWWGVTTITTVGYGDVVPITTPARIIGLILMYTGTVLFIAFTSLFAAFLVRSEVKQEISPVEKELLREALETGKIQRSLKEITRRLENIENRGKGRY